MKKILAIATLSLATLSASALELGVTAGRDFSSPNRNYGGLTFGHSMGPTSLTLGYSRTAVTGNDQDRWSVVAGYDVAKIGPVTITPTLGAAYLSNQNSDNGLAMTAGVEASMPIVNRVRAVVDWSHQLGQSRVNASNGNRVSMSVRYSF